MTFVPDYLSSWKILRSVPRLRPAIRDNLLSSPLRFTLVPVAMYRCYSHESLVSWTVFPPSIPWFPLSELCSDRRSEFPHSPTLTLGNGASASPREQGTERRDDATGRRIYRKGAKVMEPFLSSALSFPSSRKVHASISSFLFRSSNSFISLL